MLLRLELENFLLFEKAVFEFSSGLNAISGETGAGKSLIARALGLALGGRGGHDAIRAGCDEARVRAVFRVEKRWPEPARQWADAEGMVRVERLVRENGGGMSINGKPQTAQTVRGALASLVDFAAQNEQARLADPARQLELLDAHGRLDAPAAEYRELHRVVESLAKRLRAGREEKELVRLRLERVRGDLRELERVGFDPETDVDLEREIREMSHAAAIVQAAAEAAARIEGGEPSCQESLSHAWRTVERLAAVSPRLAEAGRDLQTAVELVGLALAKLGAMSEDMDADPERLDGLIGRSEKLKALARKFDCRVEDLGETRRRLAREAEELAGWGDNEDDTRKRLAALLPQLAETGKALGAKRREAAAKLARAVNRELAGLGMEQAGFEVSFEPVWREGMPLEEILAAGAAGLDEVGFFLSPNPGEAASAVADGASGGEASRAMLAIKAALSEVYRPDVMFLDEVDAGVGARLGRELGVKLAEMGKTRQVVVITHLPQIAAYAGTHLKVAKKVTRGRTIARVENLRGEERLREIASMIHGNSAGEATLRQAGEMLAEGGNIIPGRSGTEKA